MTARGLALGSALLLSPAALADPPLPPARPADEPPPAAAGATAACLKRLEELGAKAKPAPPAGEGACRVSDAVALEALPNGVKVSAGTTILCPVAEALVRWTAEVVGPAAKTQLGSGPAEVLVGTSHECRGQNRVPGAKLSEHAFANAVDVMGFAFDKGGPLILKERGEETAEGRFQAAARKGACAYFTTVLGPGSDPSHGDHLHLDLRQRPNGYRICQ